MTTLQHAAPVGVLHGRRLYAVAAITAPLILLASSIAYIVAGRGINNGLLGGTIGVWSCFVLAIALVGIVRSLEPLAPRAAPVAMVTAMLALAGGTAFNIQAINLAAYGHDVMEEATAEAAVDPIAFFAFLPWGWCGPITFVILGVLIWRTGAFPRWAGVLLAVGGLLFVVGRPSRIDPVVIITDIVLTIALVTIGWRMLGRTGAAPERAESDDR